VHVHFITIEVGVVGRTDCRVEPEGPAFHDLDTVGHDAHPVQRWLTVEEHDIPIAELAFDRVTGFDHVGNRIEIVSTEPEPAVVRADNIVGAAGRIDIRADRTIPGNLLELLDIVGGDPDRDGHLVCHGTRDSHLGHREVRVR